MRDEIVAAIIFVLLICLFTFNSYIVHNRCNGLIEEIEDTEKLLKKEGDSGEVMDDVYEKWNSQKKALFYLCGHSLIMEIDENIILGREYAKENDTPRAVRCLRRARIILEDLSDREKIKLDNIF